MRSAVALALLSVIAVSACSGGSEPRVPPSTAEPTDGSNIPPVGPPAEARPVRLPFETGLDWRIAVAPGGATALVAHSAGFFPTTRKSTIYEVTRAADGSWVDPVQPSFVSDATADIDPHYTVDGSRVWFSSIRPVDGVARTDVELWYVDRITDGSWGEPVHAAEVGSDGDDLYPSIDAGGALYFGSDRNGSGYDIWRSVPNADGTWGVPAVLPAPVTTTSWEFNPAFTPDGSMLVFTAQRREGGAGAGDLFLSRNAGGTWSVPVPLESVNTVGDEYHPAFAPDGTTFYFVRDGDLHEIAVTSTEIGS